MSSRLEPKAIRGFSWAFSGFVVTKVITLATMLVLARLLLPEDFGTVGLAVLIIDAVAYFGSFGLAPALVVRHDIGDKAVGTGLTMLALLGLASGALVLLLASTVAGVFHEPDLTRVLMVLGCALPVSALSSFYAALLQRELEFRHNFFAQATNVVVYSAVALAMAIAGAGLWSLVVGRIVATAAGAVVLVRFSPYRVRPGFDRRAARQLCSTGADFTLQGSASYAQQNVDYLAIGRVLGPTSLGLYGMAFRLSELPYYAIADPVAEVTFPGFARMGARGEDVRPHFLRILEMVALVSVPCGVVLAGAGEPFAEAVLGRPWVGMAGALSVLGIWGGLRPMQTMLGWLLNSLGHTRAVGLMSAVTVLVLAPGVFVGAHAGGIRGVAAVVVVGVAGFFLGLAVVARRRLDLALASQWRAIRPAVVAAVPAYVATRLVAGTGIGPPWLTLLLATGSGFGAYLLTVGLTHRDVLRRAIRNVGTVLRQVPDRAAPGLPAEVAAPDLPTVPEGGLVAPTWPGGSAALDDAR